MKINSLEIRNFRGINNVQLQEIGEVVLIAGANGSGKSCIFDAIRLIKSLYGGYQQNEIQQWASEFNIDLNSPLAWRAIFRDKKKIVRLRAKFTLHENEWVYIAENAPQLVQNEVSALFGSDPAMHRPFLAALTAQLSGRGEEFNKAIQGGADRLKAALTSKIIEADMVVSRVVV